MRGLLGFLHGYCAFIGEGGRGEGWVDLQSVIVCCCEGRARTTLIYLQAHLIKTLQLRTSTSTKLPPVWLCGFIVRLALWTREEYNMKDLQISLYFCSQQLLVSSFMESDPYFSLSLNHLYRCSRFLGCRCLWKVTDRTSCIVRGAQVCLAVCLKFVRPPQ